MLHEASQLENKKIKTFTLLKVIGSGAFSVVLEGVDNRDGSRVAVKAIPRYLIDKNSKTTELIGTQIRVLKNCNNENVIRFIDTICTEEYIFLVTEFCNGGNLEEYLNSRTRLAQDEASNFLKQILNGFKGLHEINAMHRDFKVANVLLHDGVCKIADLGFAKQIGANQMTRTMLGTTLTMAPEILEGNPYGIEADIWSIGIVYYQMVFGKYPYEAYSDNSMLQKIKKSRPDLNAINISPEAKDFINQCLTYSVSKRITWKRLYEHPLLLKDRQSVSVIYNLKSRINLSKNKQFYEMDPKIDDKPQLSKSTEKSVNKIQTIVQPAGDLVALRQAVKDKTGVAKSIEEYSQLYLRRRNSIMLIYKFICPYFFSLWELKTDHYVPIFVLAKNSYKELKELFGHLVCKKNFLKLEPNFDAFVVSDSYEQLVLLIKEQLQQVQIKTIYYREQIGTCDQSVKDEFDIENIVSKNWAALVEQTAKRYWQSLADELPAQQDTKKEELIKVLCALDYYYSAREIPIEQFDKSFETIVYSVAETKIMKKAKQLLAAGQRK